MPGSSSPISSRNTAPSGRQTSSQPARSLTAPVNAPRRWAEKLGLDQRGRESRQIEWMERAGQIVGEPLLVGSNGMKRDKPIARATSSLPVPEGPLINVVKSPIRLYSVRRQ